MTTLETSIELAEKAKRQANCRFDKPISYGGVKELPTNAKPHHC